MSSRACEIVTLGYVSVDHFLRVSVYPSIGQKVPFQQYCVAGGGQAATAAICLSRWGIRTRFVGRVGDDATGDQSISWLEEEGVICDGVMKTRGETTQTAYIIVPENCGERTVFWRRGAHLNLQAADLQRNWFDNASVLLTDGHELDAACLAAQWVKHNGGVVVLDAEHIGNRHREILKLTDIAVGSEDFGAREFNASTHTETLAILRSFGVGIAGVTLGKKGVAVDWGDGIKYFRSIDVDVVDTTGAGDVFHAGLAYAAYRRMAPERMFAFSSVCAGLSVTRLGGRSAIPSLRTVLMRLKTEGNMEILHE
jgi:sulfofructose kinase